MFVVVTQKGPNWLHDRQVREQPGWDQHARFFDQLVERGLVILGGPISGDSEDVALLAVDAANEQELRSTLAEDPWATSGVLTIKEVRAWTIWLDGR